jgi:hypothetical protein
MRVSGAEPECERTRRELVYPVSGKVTVYRSSCGYERGRVPLFGEPIDPNRKGICGRDEARYFEPKGKVSPPFPWPPAPRIVRDGEIPPLPPAPTWACSTLTPVKPKRARKKRS